MADLARDYEAGCEALAPFYDGWPRDLLRVPPGPATWDEALREAVREYQARLGAPKPIREDTALIITGQQPCIFTGPLYTIFKAATAVRLAARLRDSFGVPCQPVFWVASEDHDFEEAREVHLLTKRHEPLRLRYEPETLVAGAPMFRVPVEASLHGLIDRAAAEAPGAEFSREVTELLHDTLDASASLADWTARVLAHLFRETDLLIFAPHMEAARWLAAPVMRKEVEEPLETTARLESAGSRLEGLGYKPQIARRPTECNFFLQMGDARRKVTFREGRFRIAGEGLSCSQAEMLTLLEAAPERFSPNVALRCVVQQELFGPAAYVAGPGEVAYWAQLRPVFDRFSLPVPVVYPRARGVISDIKLNKLLARLGLSLEALYGPPDDALQAALRNTADSPALDTLRQGRRAVEGEAGRLREALASCKGPWDQAARRIEERLARQFDRLERAIVNEDDRRKEAVAAQVDRLRISLAPGRKPQERVYTVFSWLFERGWDLVPRAMREVDVESFEVNWVEL